MNVFNEPIYILLFVDLVFLLLHKQVASISSIPIIDFLASKKWQMNFQPGLDYKLFFQHSKITSLICRTRDSTKYTLEPFNIRTVAFFSFIETGAKKKRTGILGNKGYKKWF